MTAILWLPKRSRCFTAWKIVKSNVDIFSFKSTHDVSYAAKASRLTEEADGKRSGYQWEEMLFTQLYDRLVYGLLEERLKGNAQGEEERPERFFLFHCRNQIFFMKKSCIKNTE